MAVVFCHDAHTLAQHLRFLYRITIVQLGWAPYFIFIQFNNKVPDRRFGLLISPFEVSVVGLIFVIKLNFLYFGFATFAEDGQVKISLSDTFLVLCEFHLLNFGDGDRLIFLLTVVDCVALALLTLLRGESSGFFW